MALVFKCEACGEKISQTDLSCPKCKHDESKLMFEYQELREERNKNRSINYSAIVIFIGGAGYAFKETYPLVGLTYLFIAYIIDCKNRWFNDKRVKSMKIIENRMGFKNLELVEELALGDTPIIKSVTQRIGEQRKEKIRHEIKKIPTHLFFIVGVILFFIRVSIGFLYNSRFWN